jgi:glycosyltransferase involved in cell wall biosynthesis
MSADGDIAVVIPCHDDGATLEETVESVLAQDVPAEIIVVDDGSTDPGTEAALERVAARGALVLRQANQGPGPARMAGVRATGAEYVLPLDADDRLVPGALRLLRAELERNRRAVAAWGSARHFGSLDFVQLSLQSLDPWQLTYQNHLPLSALYRRAAVLRAGGWQLEGGYEDWDLWMAMAERGFRGVYAPGMQFRYRISADGRMWSDAMSKHERLHARVRERHTGLYADRRANRRRSSARPREKLLFPLIDTMPGLHLATRQRLIDLVHDPGHIIVPRLRAVARRLTGG